MKRKELKAKLNELESDIYQNEYSYGKDALKSIKSKIGKLKRSIIKLTPPLIPGGEMELDDFLIQIKSNSKTDSPKTRFLKDHKYRFTPEQFKILDEMIGYEMGLYKYFNNKLIPTNITKTKLSCVKEEVESNNIYDVMCAPQITTFRYEFQIKISYDGEPITVFYEAVKNTTLSRRDVNNFM